MKTCIKSRCCLPYSRHWQFPADSVLINSFFWIEATDGYSHPFHMSTPPPRHFLTILLSALWSVSHIILEILIFMLLSVTLNIIVLHVHRKFLSLEHYAQLQRWSYWREHLKYVWNVYCVLTNHRRDHHTTEPTGNERFPICHGTNYFHFVLTFSVFLQVNNCFSFLFVYSIYYNSEEYRFERFWNKLQSRCAGPTHATVWREKFSNFL